MTHTDKIWPMRKAKHSIYHVWSSLLIKNTSLPCFFTFQFVPLIPAIKLRVFSFQKKTCFTSTPQWHPTSHPEHPLKRPSLRTSAPYCIVATTMLGVSTKYTTGWVRIIYPPNKHVPIPPIKKPMFFIFAILPIGDLCWTGCSFLGG